MASDDIYKAEFPFNSNEEGELAFDAGDLIKVYKKDKSGWWFGENLETGEDGDFPYNYVSLVDEFDALGSNGAPETNEQQEFCDMISSFKVSAIAETTTFQLEMYIENKGYKVVKSLSDIRQLDDDLKEFVPGFTFPLPPMWADKYQASESLEKRRTGIIEEYFYRLLKQRKNIVHFAVINWLNPRISMMVFGELVRQYTKKMNTRRKRPSHVAAFANVSPLAIVLYPWSRQDALEIDLVKGEVIAVKKTDGSIAAGWFEGETADGEKGIFPGNYVEMLPPEVCRRIVLGEMSNEASVEKKSGGTTLKRKEINFGIPTMDAFDELLDTGITMVNGKEPFESQSTNMPEEGDEISLKYTAYVWDCQQGTIFEFASSNTKDISGYTGPLEFVLGQGHVIEGIEMAMEYMGEGDSTRLIVRPDKGYGNVGNPPYIPPKVHLVYDLTVTKIEKAEVPGPPPPPMDVDFDIPPAPSEDMGQQELAESYEKVAGRLVQRTSMWQPVVDRAPRTSTASASMLGRGSFMTRGSFMSARPSVDGSVIELNDDYQYTDITSTSNLDNIQESKSKSKSISGLTSNLDNIEESNSKSKSVVNHKNPRKYDLKKLQEIVRTKAFDLHLVDPTFIENHLTAKAFVEAFQVPRSKWAHYPMWRQSQLKQEARLE